jgi:RNA polymerase sigma-70 factor (ECF subfamily)
VSKDIKELFVAHRRGLQSYLTGKLRDAETAADLTQEVFARFAARERASGAEAIMGDRFYLYRMARNLAVDHLRQRRRDINVSVSPEALDRIADQMPSPERTAHDNADVRRVRAALAELPERTRQVVCLARLDGLTHREVAEHLRISDSSVQKHLAKATQHVMKRLRDPR